MRVFIPLLLFLLVIVGIAASADAREWSNPDGQFKLEAEVIAFNPWTVVLKRPSGKLVAIELAELSQSDRDYIASKEATDSFAKSADEMQTWTAFDGMMIRGRVIAYGKKDLVITRRVGNVFVNGIPFARMAPLHQSLVLKIVSHLENEKLETERDLEAWAKPLGADAKTYPLQGVLMKLESGDEISLPFFMFAKKDLAVLQPGWERWLSQEKYEQEQARENLMVQSSAMQYQRANQRYYQVERMKLDMLAAATGVSSIWEVIVEPRQGVYGHRTSIMVTARNSDIATRMVAVRYPAFAVIGVRRANF
ncbi:hypothetical protein Pla52o_51880 [Novipirellula galeiformis]|uniref:SLA1 homology domain-containing protein n=1 Tax=Novipirellula galeiformis TaxID=2528004 RepID=A0A5C6C2D2_9BACT|nr:SHD1 domain-containing protein [Novipirellula galeiformis]TWU17384.1 hypothetical protein Pla52o_51880 [Novipirellula galeiformis]